MFFEPENHVIKMIVTGLLLTGIATGLSACKPPTKSELQAVTTSSGRTIVKAAPEEKPPFETTLIEGKEFIVSRGEVGQSGGTFFDNQIGEGPRTFNPWAGYDATSSEMAQMMFSGLVETDPYTGEVIPWMAKSLEISEDQKTYTLTLREGLVWSDGRPITSDDVVFTWRDIIGAGLGNPSSRDNNLVNGQFPTIKALDDKTVEFTTVEPFAPFMRNLGFAIAPKHIIKPVIDEGGSKAFSSFWGSSDAVNKPDTFVSSNMWLLESYEPGQRVVFKRNPNYFVVDKKGQQLPYLDKYVISFVSDMNNVQLQFEQGKSDSYSVPGQYLTHIRQLPSPDFTLYNLGPTTSTSFMAFNLTKRKDSTSGRPLVKPNTSKWFNNQQFRKAIDYAISRKDMVNNILKSVGEPLFTAEALPSIFINDAIKKGHEKDIELAKTFLKEGGFKWDSNGQLLDNNSNKVEFDLITNAGNDQRESVGVTIKEDLAALGMKVNFKAMDFNILIGKLNEGHWETMIMGLTGSPLEPHSGANVWKSDGALHLFNQRDVSSGRKPNLSDRLPWEVEIDDIYEKASLELDFEKRKEFYDRYQEIIYEQRPLIYLFSPLSIVAIRDRLKNVDPTPLGVFHNMYEIYIEE